MIRLLLDKGELVARIGDITFSPFYNQSPQHLTAKKKKKKLRFLLGKIYIRALVRQIERVKGHRTKKKKEKESSKALSISAKRNKNHSHEE